MNLPQENVCKFVWDRSRSSLISRGASWLQLWLIPRPINSKNTHETPNNILCSNYRFFSRLKGISKMGYHVTIGDDTANFVLKNRTISIAD